MKFGTIFYYYHLNHAINISNDISYDNILRTSQNQHWTTTLLPRLVNKRRILIVEVTSSFLSLNC